MFGSGVETGLWAKVRWRVFWKAVVMRREEEKKGAGQLVRSGRATRAGANVQRQYRFGIFLLKFERSRRASRRGRIESSNRGLWKRDRGTTQERDASIAIVSLKRRLVRYFSDRKSAEKIGERRVAALMARSLQKQADSPRAHAARKAFQSTRARNTHSFFFFFFF